MRNISLIVCVLLVLPFASLSAEPKLIKISVRTIHAIRNSDAAAPADTQAVAIRSEGQRVDAGLMDLEKKFMALPYHYFRLLAAKEEELCVKKKQSLSLPNGQSLSFRPVRMEDKKVGLWISWRDAEGMEILNTRIHFDTDYSVLTGMEESPSTGLILAIKASEIKAHTPVVE